MGFSRDTTSLTGFVEAGVPVNNPAFATWDRDTLAQGTDWGLGQGWQLNINPSGTELSFKYGSEIPFAITSDGEATLNTLAMPSLKLDILSSLPEVASYQLGEVVNVLGYLYVKQEDPS